MCFPATHMMQPAKDAMQYAARTANGIVVPPVGRAALLRLRLRIYQLGRGPPLSLGSWAHHGQRRHHNPCLSL
jgi:hypothetical protein